MTDKRSQNECGENSVTIVTEKKIEDDSSDSSSGENVDIDGKSLQEKKNINASHT